MSLSLAIPGANGQSWTGLITSVPAGCASFSFSASNSSLGTITAFSGSGGTLSTAVGMFSHLLVPGTGWVGPTPTPSIQGNPTMNGYSQAENAIARWNVVPYQTFAMNFNVGVLAFHSSGIHHVSLAVNGGNWIDVVTPSVNPQTANNSGIGVSSTGTREYWATLRASDFSDGQFEVRAIAYPNIGRPIVSESLYLNANAGGTLTRTPVYVSTGGSDTAGNGTLASPYATIGKGIQSVALAHGGVADGAVIDLLAGSYAVPSKEDSDTTILSSTGWIYIQAAPGVPRGSVTITGTAANFHGDKLGLYAQLVAVGNVTMTEMVVGSANLINASQNSSTWFYGVEMTGPGRTAGPSFRDNNLGNSPYGFRYITDASVHDMQDAPDLINIWRNSALSTLAQSGIHNSYLSVNCTVDDINPIGTSGLHPDGWQITLDRSQFVAYKLALTNLTDCEGMRIQPAGTDIAMVDCSFPIGNSFEMERPYTNLLIANSTFGGDVYVASVLFAPVDMYFDGCTFNGLAPSNQPGLTVR